MAHFQRYRRAQSLFEARDYRGAARELERLLAESDGDLLHSMSAARLLLARAYFHSAQLRGAEETTRAILRDEPVDAYAALLLARTLERSGRRDEAVRALALATALGAPGLEQRLDNSKLDNSKEEDAA
jgi:predicted Zn-dependent protease